MSKQRGNCLVPVFALGRAQELLLILDEFWQANRHIQVSECECGDDLTHCPVSGVQHIPVYYASGMASRALRVYQTYINMMNNHIRSRQLERPFHFNHVRNLNRAEEIDESRPSVVLASPGCVVHLRQGEGRGAGYLTHFFMCVGVGMV